MGFYRDNARWLGAGLLLCLGSSFGQTFFISLFAGEIMAEFALSDGAWSTIYMVGTLASAALLVQAGGLADRMPLGRLAGLVIAGYAGVAAAMWANPSVLLLPVLIFGLRFCGQGMMGHIAMTAMGKWFEARRGRAVAIAGLGYSLGEAVLPALFTLAILGLGWRGGWALAALALGLVVFPLATRLLAVERVPEGEAGATRRAGMGGRHWTRGEMLRHWAFWAVLPGVLSPSFIGTVVFFHQVHTGAVKGWDPLAMALGYPLYAGATVAASLAAGWAVDRFSARRLLPLYLLPIGAGMALIGPAEGVSAWYAVLALTGIGTGIANAMWGGFWPELYGTRHLGAIKGLAHAAMVLGSAIGPFLTGWAIDFGAPFPAQGLSMAVWCAGLSALYLALVPRLLRA